jgi:GTPase SAR1 family protein
MWLKELKTHANPDIKIFLIGNKIDLADSRKVTEEEAMKFKDDYMLNLYMETSAKTGFNAREIFIEAARVLFKEYNQYKKVDEEKKIKLPNLSEQDPKEVIEKKKCSC